MFFFPGYVTDKEDNGSIIVCSSLRQNKIRISDKEFIKEFELLKKQGGCRELSTPLRKLLYEQEFLQTIPEIEASLQKVKKLLDNELFLTIMPTEECNFRCQYCYEAHSPQVISAKRIEHIKQYILEQLPNCKNIHIGWFGGEPTLCKSIILEFSNFLKKLQVQHNICYNADMTTNGFLLDKKSFIQYYDAGITGYQITLDGFQHDSLRPHVSGKRTLQTILNNLSTLSALPKDQYQFHITLRRNILAGEQDYSWYDYLAKLFGDDSRFSVSVVSVNDWGGDAVKSLDILAAEQKQAIYSAHENYLNKVGLVLNKKTTYPFSNICCASRPKGFIFRANGNIEKCTIAIDNPNNKVGYIDTEKGVILDKNACDRWCTSNVEPKCFTCPDILSCLNQSCRKGVILDGKPDGYCVCALVGDC